MPLFGLISPWISTLLRSQNVYLKTPCKPGFSLNTNVYVILFMHKIDSKKIILVEILINFQFIDIREHL